MGVNILTLVLESPSTHWDMRMRAFPRQVDIHLPDTSPARTFGELIFFFIDLL